MGVINFYHGKIPTQLSELTNDVGYVTQSTVVVNHKMPETWNTNGTMAQLINSIQNDDNAVEGKSYIGTVSISDLPSGLGQAELKAEITKGSTVGNKIIVFTVESEDVAPYHWERVSAYGRSGYWRSFVTPSDLPKAITLSALPSENTDTVAKLNAIGLTQSEILAASQGKRTGVIYNGVCYTILSVHYNSSTNYSILFGEYGVYKLPPELEDDTLFYRECNIYYVLRNGDYVGANATNIPANTRVIPV